MIAIGAMKLRNEIGVEVPTWVILHALKAGMTKPDIRDAYALTDDTLDRMIDAGIRILKQDGDERDHDQDFKSDRATRPSRWID